MRRDLRRVCLLLACVAVAAASGCSKVKTVTITGRLTKDGKPLQAPKDAYVTLTFLPDPGEDAPRSYPAKLDREAWTYKVDLPAGRYRANIYVPDPKKKSPPPLKSQGDPKYLFDFNESKEVDIEVPQ